MEDRYTEIERENRILLEKMTMIMHNKHSSLGGRHAKSLNKGYRQRELVKITGENQALLKRLQEKQPNYNTHQWEEDRRVAERRLKNICEYPYQLGITAEGRPRNLSVEMRQTTSAAGPKSVNTSHQRTSTGKSRRLNPIGKAVVFKRGVHIGDNYFIVEMILAADKLIIFVHEVDQPSSFSLELSMQEAFEIMGGTENYEALAGMLNFENGEIVLNEPQEDTPKRDRQLFQAPKQPVQLEASSDEENREELPSTQKAAHELPQDHKAPPSPPAKAQTPPPEEAVKSPTPPAEAAHKASEESLVPEKPDEAELTPEQEQHLGSPPDSLDSSVKPEEASSGLKSNSPREHLEEPQEHAQPEISHVSEAVEAGTVEAAQEPRSQPSEPAKSELEVSQGEVMSSEKEGGEPEAGGVEAGEPSE
jgi:hypothetical protein